MREITFMPFASEPPEIEIVPTLVSEVIELLDPEKVIAVNINRLLQTLMNFVFRQRNIKIEVFQHYVTVTLFKV